MKNIWAKDFYEIIATLSSKEDLLENIKVLIETKEITGKSLEGGNRKEIFRDVLTDLVQEEITLQDSYQIVETKLSEGTSIYRGNKRVFPTGWAERLVRTNLSKFYNQAVLEEILKSGKQNCFIPHSKHEDSTSKCSAIAGQEHDAKLLLDRLVESYENGKYTSDIKIPNHPHCTHVVTPID